MTQLLDPEKAMRLRLEASKVFTPAAPIDEKALFAGRTAEIEKVIDTINQRGQHAIIFGERGVGKTSLANVLTPWLRSLGEQVIVPRVNCDGTDTFASVWKKMFAEFHLAKQIRKAGFNPDVIVETTSFADEVSEDITPDGVRRMLMQLGQNNLLVVVFDEFDRLNDRGAQSLFADTVKSLSDHSVRATLVLVGVADTVDQLIVEHQSVQRALVQIQMKRMAPDELRVIVQSGLARLDMEINPDALEDLVQLSQGLPHYTHLLGLHVTRKALDHRVRRVRMDHLTTAIGTAVDEAQQSVRNAYAEATRSARRDNLYASVLLACALAEADELGYFAAADVREPLRRITGTDIDIPTFSQHLNNFCEGDRGPILQKAGASRRYRFRFTNPLMQPFVTLKGYVAGKIPEGIVVSRARQTPLGF